ncbi:hypothetical protein Taro_013668 [Colocasia esculenta]|uniref:3-hydroxyacyl-CoA dehydrogenase n=1 Tax=Colocasia esculenta TaxID=4460 RepID=A0A843UGN8_COLES|nr:hypothetical protein [Colocasia esculenta]
MAKFGVSMEVGSDGVAVITISNPPVNALAPASNRLGSFSPPLHRLFLRYRILIWFSPIVSGALCLLRISVPGMRPYVYAGFDSRLGRIGFHYPIFFRNAAPSGGVDLSSGCFLPILDIGLEVLFDVRMPCFVVLEVLFDVRMYSFRGAVVDGLKKTYTEAMRRDDVKAIVLTGASGKFSGGFDINVFEEIHRTGQLSRLPDVSVELVVDIIEEGKKPSVAAIQGLALGGGLELTMGCHARISTPNAQLGLPELTLGVIPGFGGTQRLPRLVGLSKAIEMMLLSKSISAKEGNKLGLIDAIASHEELLREAKLFKELVLSSTSKGLVHVFFAQRATSKVPKISDIGLKPKNVKKVAVIGGGLMGSGIATALIQSNISVLLKEVDSTYLQRGLKMIAANLEGLVKKGAMTQDKMNKTLSLVKGVLDYSEFRDVDMVIEAVIEKVPLKQTIFSDIEKACTPQCILATNTSTIDLNIVGAKTRSQDRIVGAHFFSPAHVMPLLEIVRTEKTSPQVILDLMTVGKVIRKVPVVVGNCTGFAVNRTFFPYSQAAHLLANLGVDIFRVDRVINSFGMPMGPFQLQDLAGYGVAFAVKKEYAVAFRGRTFESELLELMAESGRNGKNNGKGFYIYEKGSKPRPDPSVRSIIEESIRRANILPGGKPVTLTDQEILEMIFFPVVNEACRVLDEGVVVRASDLDIASVLGMGFPRYRGGLVFWADSIGAAYIHASLSRLAEAYGSFFKPSPYLEERAKKGMPLRDPPCAVTWFESSPVVEEAAHTDTGARCLGRRGPPLEGFIRPVWHFSSIFVSYL